MVVVYGGYGGGNLVEVGMKGREDGYGSLVMRVGLRIKRWV